MRKEKITMPYPPRYPQRWEFDNAEPYKGLAPFVYDGTKRVHTRQEWEELKVQVDAFYASMPDVEIECHNTCMMIEEKKRRDEFMLPRAEKQKRAGKVRYVYIMQSQEHYKIGISYDPQGRLKAFSSLPGGTKLLHFFPAEDAKKAERELHRRYSEQRVSGEWFKLHPANVAYLCEIKEYRDGAFW